MASVDAYRRIEQQMREKFPTQIEEAEKLADDIAPPADSDANACWAKLWDKPLYAYIKTQIAERYCEQLRPSVTGSKWQAWAGGDRPYLGINGAANRNANFQFTDSAPDELTQLRIPRIRLFAVQGAAQALAARAAHTNRPFANLEGVTSVPLIIDLMREFGPRWGHITVMHFLADLGLCCKPDRWLLRTARRLLRIEVRENVNTPNLREAIRIDEAVKQLVKRLDGALTPRRLRYVDKILMEAGKQGVFERA